MQDIRDRKFENELTFSATRSSGPGGQNVNKVSTRVELRFNINKSAVLEYHEKNLLQTKLARRINKEGELILTSQTERSQLGNKEKVTDKFYRLLEKSLIVAPPRKRTLPTVGSRTRRLESKQILSVKKTRRRKVGPEE
jgi:ribosome-associated protein